MRTLFPVLALLLMLPSLFSQEALRPFQKRIAGLEKRYRFLLAEARRLPISEQYGSLKTADQAKADWLEALALAGLPAPEQPGLQSPEAIPTPGKKPSRPWLEPEKGAGSSKELAWQSMPRNRVWEPVWGDSLREHRSRESVSVEPELSELSLSSGPENPQPGRKRTLSPFQGGAAEEIEARSTPLRYKDSRIIRLSPPAGMKGVDWRLWYRYGEGGDWRQSFRTGKGLEALLVAHGDDSRVDYAFIPAGKYPDPHFKAFFSYQIDTNAPVIEKLALRREKTGALVVEWGIRDDHLDGGSVTLNGYNPEGGLLFAESPGEASGLRMLQPDLREQDLVKVMLRARDLAGHEVTESWTRER